MCQWSHCSEMSDLRAGVAFMRTWTDDARRFGIGRGWNETLRRLAEGKSVYNCYPRVLETEGKLARVRSLTRSGLFFLMYLCSGEN